MRVNASYMSILSSARSMFAAGDLGGARDAVQAAIALEPGRPGGWAILAKVLEDSGDLDGAATHADRALDLAPGDTQFLNLATYLALRRGRFAEARTRARKALEVAPGNQRARCDLILAEQASGGSRASAELLDYKKHVSLFFAEPPIGFASIAAFNNEVAEAVRLYLQEKPGHGAATLVGGQRIEDAFDLPDDVARSLRSLMTAALDRYVDTRLAQGKPNRTRITAWANVMHAGHHEVPHIHETGLISGVYYPRMPNPAADSEAGRLIFGEHQFGSVVPPLPTLSMLPQAGQVVLFPSYMYHRTVPFEGAGQRISIAFDIAA